MNGAISDNLFTLSIFKFLSVTINGTKATVDSKIHVYSNDRGIDLHINLVNFDYVIRSLNQDVLKASARVLKPNRKEYFDIDTLRVEDKTIIFTITQAMTDEFDEIGRYSVQIHLFDLEGNRITIPPIDFYVNELVARDSIPIDSYAMADISEVDLYKAAPSDYVPVEGQYIRTWWYTGDYITSAKLNNLENGVLTGEYQAPEKPIERLQRHFELTNQKIESVSSTWQQLQIELQNTNDSQSAEKIRDKLIQTENQLISLTNTADKFKQKITESMRSSTPPCPGMILPKSLIP
mgnify:CR=1 FL=1